MHNNTNYTLEERISDNIATNIQQQINYQKKQQQAIEDVGYTEVVKFGLCDMFIAKHIRRHLCKHTMWSGLILL